MVLEFFRNQLAGCVGKRKDLKENVTRIHFLLPPFQWFTVGIEAHISIYSMGRKFKNVFKHGCHIWNYALRVNKLGSGENIQYWILQKRRQNMTSCDTFTAIQGERSLWLSHHTVPTAMIMSLTTEQRKRLFFYGSLGLDIRIYNIAHFPKQYSMGKQGTVCVSSIYMEIKTDFSIFHPMDSHFTWTHQPTH